MTDFSLTTSSAEMPAIGRIRNGIERLRDAKRLISDAWANRPRFQTYHEMIAEYEPEGRAAPKPDTSRPFSELPPVNLPGLF